MKNWSLYVNGIRLLSRDSYMAVYNYKMFLERTNKVNIPKDHVAVLPEDSLRNAFKKPFRVLIENGKISVVDNSGKFKLEEVNFILKEFKHIFKHFDTGPINMITCRLTDNELIVEKQRFEFASVLNLP